MFHVFFNLCWWFRWVIQTWSFFTAIISDLNCICCSLFCINLILIFQSLWYLQFGYFFSILPCLVLVALYLFKCNCIFLVSICWSRILNIICQSFANHRKNFPNINSTDVSPMFYAPWNVRKEKIFWRFQSM